AVLTAQAFLDGVGYDGVVLTKLDGDARGGAALSIRKLTGRPVMFASIGEKLEDFDVFHPDRMASRILDLGDVLSLIEQAERTFDQDQAAAMAGKLTSGEGFTLEDFVEQLAMVRKLGPIGNLLGMLPGAAQNRELLSQVSDKDLDRAAAIINSMTIQERRNPKILNGSRRARIAAGSGVTVGEVNQLIVRFFEAQKMMRQMMGSMPGMGGMRRASKARGKAKKKGKGGGRPAGVSRAAGQPAGAAGPAGRAAAAGLDGGAATAGGLVRPGAVGPSALPGFGSLPGLGSENGGGFRLPNSLGGQGGAGQPSPPPAFRGRPGKKGR
ncbi:MAG TPA: signal recognition particle protein, partial [Streptosporangiaceae bacterium]|nr:signal recognition particle protein [Streptosporangiaceae bacterium]